MSEDNENWRMYVPRAYEAAGPRSIVRDFPFALLVTAAPKPFATYTPIYFEDDKPETLVLVGHMAAENPQAEHLRPNSPALAIFSGPHAYVSASWYKERPTVPTWNYIAAQVRGTLSPIDDREGKLAVLERTAALVETGSTPPWTLADAPQGRVNLLLPRIRAFRIEISRIDGVTKLSQPQPPADRKSVIRALERRGAPADLEIARQMRALERAN